MLGIMIDTETTNGLDDPLAYDVGWQVIDIFGNVYASRSFVNEDIFNWVELMQEAFFKDKIPQYKEDIQNGKRVLSNLYMIREKLKNDVENFNCEFICAHNARFDYISLNTTQRYLTKSKYRYFVPYGLEWWDTLKMCREVLGKSTDYIEWCKENGYTFGKNKRPRLTAEIVYRYISNDTSFVESHTGLEDVDIERQILAYCIGKNKNVKRELWAPKEGPPAATKNFY